MVQVVECLPKKQKNKKKKKRKKCKFLGLLFDLTESETGMSSTVPPMF
jgi:hypothetical protein